MARTHPFRFILIMVTAAALTACASGPFVKTDSGYEREPLGTWEQRTADEYRKAGASDAAREPQKRADKALEQERSNPVGTFLSELVASLLDLFVSVKSK